MIEWLIRKIFGLPKPQGRAQFKRPEYHDPSSLKSEYEADMAVRRSELEAEVASLQSEYDAETSSSRSEFEAEMIARRSEFEAEVGSLQSEYDAETSSLRSEFEAEAKAFHEDLEDENLDRSEQEVSQLWVYAINRVALEKPDFFELVEDDIADVQEKVRQRLSEDPEIVFTKDIAYQIVLGIYNSNAGQREAQQEESDELVSAINRVVAEHPDFFEVMKTNIDDLIAYMRRQASVDPEFYLDERSIYCALAMGYASMVDQFDVEREWQQQQAEREAEQKQQGRKRQQRSRQQNDWSYEDYQTWEARQHGGQYGKQHQQGNGNQNQGQRRNQQSRSNQGYQPAQIAEEKMLKVKAGASMAEISKAYRKLVRRYHPDQFATATHQKRSANEKRMKEINAAYSVLKKLRG